MNSNPFNNPLINRSQFGGFGMHPQEKLNSLMPFQVRNTAASGVVGVGSNPSLPAWQLLINNPARI